MKLITTAVSCGLTVAFAACGAGRPSSPDAWPTATPIKHLVVIFGENVSFDHYFATYPLATNPPGEPRFMAAPETPRVNGLAGTLLTRNPNLTNHTNRVVASNPFRLDRTQAATADQAHDYTLEQLAYDDGAADLFPHYTGRGGPGGPGGFFTPALVMGYYDGNTVTALWNYAQHFAMSDDAYSDQYGPSTPGAINLISGQTNGVVIVKSIDSSAYMSDGQGGATLINDIAPAGDVCSDSLFKYSTDQARFIGKNIGDLLSAAGVPWGWFQGGFDLTVTNTNGTGGCERSTVSPVTHLPADDYIAHHEPFQYYASTANPRHTRPSSTSAVGTNHDGANHQYDVRDFVAAVRAGAFPAVAFLKAPGYQDAHAGYSDPLDEQTFVVQVINFLEQRPEWSSTAVIILYDDSDGWYDHQMAPVGNASYDARRDRLSGPGACGSKATTLRLGGVAGQGPVNGRCGPGTRQPFLVVSPWAKVNYVDHTRITQVSVTRFIEDNWLEGARLGGGSFDATAGSIDGLFDFAGGGKAAVLFLDDALGTVVATPSGRLPG
jgi:phospholipase C